MATIGKCEVCVKPTTYRCGKCWNAYYCSKVHQRASWKNHQGRCRPFKICKNEELGRHIIATKPIKEGDVVLQELPLVLGPHVATSPICMGCLNTLDNKPILQCEKCGWPVCSEECQNNPKHKPECYYTVKWGRKLSKSQCESSHRFCAAVIILRVLYQKKFVPDVWKKVDELESHGQKSENSTYFAISMLNALSDYYNVFGVNRKFSEEEIRKVSRILEINAFCVGNTKPPHTSLYEIASLFEHSCKGNCYTSFNSNGMLRVIAGVPIEKGDHLSICYINAFWPAIKRQYSLQRTKLFTCHCKRCIDVTEFGTYFSAFKCENKGCDGLALPENFLTSGLQWNCNKCNFEISADFVTRSVSYAFKFLKISRNIALIKGLIQNKRCPNYASLKLKVQLMSKVGSGNQGCLKHLSDEDLELKVNLCREIMKLTRLIAPAEKMATVDILSHLQNSLAEMSRRKQASGTFNHQDAVGILNERKSLLHEIIKSIRYEYSCRQKLKTAKVALKMVKCELKKLD